MALRVALIQLRVGRDKAANVANAVRLVGAAAAQGARLVVLPECFQTPYGTAFFPEYAEVVPGGLTSEAMRGAAMEHRVTLVAGSIPEAQDGKVFNCSAAWGADGALLGKYRKMHLFRLNTEKVTFDEGETLTAGDRLATFEAHGLTFGMGICFDVRFAEFALSYNRLGATVLLYPGAFNMVTGPAHWLLHARARAVDTQSYVIMCAPARDPDSVSGYVAYGHSVVVDPWGDVLAEAGEDEEIIYADVDPARVAAVRRQLPIESGRRHDLYGVHFTPGPH